MNLQTDSVNCNLKYGLYIVSTPIGNLEDITLRALKVLRKAAYILCEDTRISRKLLSKYKIQSKLISNHKFNEKKNLKKIIDILKSEKIVSLISDAGTPIVSDPGRILVKECINNKINLISIPGPSALVAAFSISGFSDQFLFYGFFPEKKSVLISELKKLSEFNYSLVFFSSPKKINKIIPEIKNFFFGRKIILCREITKYYEEYIRKNVNDLELFDKEPKGEITVVISEKIRNKNNSEKLSESDMNIIKKMINKISIKEITEIISQNKKISKKEIYNYCLKIKNEN